MNPHRPVVDVIIPSFNRAYCIARAVDSVLAQTHPFCRAIVVDDGSTDETEALFGQRYGSNARVTYLRRLNGGVSAARNTGLAAVNGDYVAFLDSDDIWKPWKIQLQLDCLRFFPQAEMIWTDMTAIDSADNLVAERYLRTMYGGYARISTETLFSQSAPIESVSTAAGTSASGRRLYCGNIFSQMILGNLVHTSTVLLTNARARKVGLFNESLRYSGEDFDFHLRTCREGLVAFADVPSINYRVGNQDQLTQPAYHVHIAKNYLKTVLPVIQSDRARITLTDREIATKLSGAHAWVADESLRALELKAARQNAWQSLRLNPLQSHTWLVLAATFVPAPVLGAMIHVYHSAKQMIADLPPFDMFI